MAKKFIGLLAGMAVIAGAATLFAQEGAKPAKAAEGTLMVGGKNYRLTHALAYETTINEEEVIAVVLSGQAISSEQHRSSFCRARLHRRGTGRASRPTRSAAGRGQAGASQEGLCPSAQTPGRRALLRLGGSLPSTCPRLREAALLPGRSSLARLPHSDALLRLLSKCMTRSNTGVQRI